MRIKILGRWWRLAINGRLGRNDNGKCDPPDKPGKEITIRSTLRGQLRLEVLIHEMIHAAGWHLDEDYVAEFAVDVARVLWRLGYRGPR